MRPAVAALFLSILVSCHRDPEAEKRQLLDKGDKYYNRGQYKQASVLYRVALQKDKRYSLGYYKLALADLKLGQISKAVDELRRAIELLPERSFESTDAKVRLADIYLLATREKRYLDEVDGFAAELLRRDPNSFEGHRLKGDLAFIGAQQAVSSTHPDEEKKLLKSAIGEYRKANAAKPGQPNAIAALARALAQNKEYREAEKFYREALAQDRSMAAGYRELYEVYLLENRPSDAEALLKSAAASNPKDFQYPVMLAGHYYRQKQRANMDRVLDQIDSRAKEFPAAYLTTGDFYLRVGEGGEAIRRYRLGIAADRQHESIYQKRIIEVLIRQGNKTSAAEMNDEILKKSPHDPDARSLRASLLLDKRQVQPAITELESLIAAAPKDYVTRYNLARAYAAHGDYQPARQRYSETIAMRPDYIPARVGLAQLLVMRGEFEEGMKLAAGVLKIDKTNAQAQFILSDALWGMKRAAESDRELQGLLQANAKSPDVLYQVASEYLRRKNYQEAEAAFRRMQAADPADPRGLLGIKEIYVSRNQSDKAIELLQSELRKSPGRTDYRMALGNTLSRAGKFDPAIAEYTQVASAMKEQSNGAGLVYFRLGEAYRLKGDFENAVLMLQKARKAQPDSAAIAGSLGQALDSAGHKREAKQSYEDCLSLDGQNGMALNNLAFLLSENNGDLDQALTYAQRARRLLPHASDVSDTLGQIYLKKQLTDNAVETLREVVSEQPGRPIFRYHLGLAYAQKGQKDKAIQELEIALKSNPAKDEEVRIRELLKKLSAIG